MGGGTKTMKTNQSDIKKTATYLLFSLQKNACDIFFALSLGADG
jgi:hypothetical protein